jgi:transcriptional regulator with XRE-family HTH domain
MRIGHNLRRIRESKGWTQDAFAHLVGVGQSTISNIESNKQDVTWEQIELFSQKLEITPEEMIRQDAPIFNSLHQQGGQANNYIIQNGAEEIISAKNDTISALQALIREKDIRIQLLEFEVERLKKA